MKPSTKAFTDRTMAAVKRVAKPTVSLQTMRMVGDHTAAALFQAHTAPETCAEFAAIVEATYDGRVRVLPGSAHRPSAAKDLVLAFVTINRESRPADEEGAAGLTAVTANVFRDEDDAIWARVGEGESAMLVRQTEEDLESILLARQAASLVTASARISLVETASVGNAIGFYDFQRESERFGILIGDNLAVELSTGAILQVPEASINLVANTSTGIVLATAMAHNEVKSAVARKELSPTNMISRYTKYASALFAKNGAYMKKLEALLRMSYSDAALRA